MTGCLWCCLMTVFGKKNTDHNVAPKGCLFWKDQKPPSQTASWLLRCLVGVLLFRPALVTQTPSQDLLSKKNKKQLVPSGAVASFYKCRHWLDLLVQMCTLENCIRIKEIKKKNPIKKSLKVNVWWGWKHISNTQLSSTERRENKWSPVRRIGVIYRPSTIFYGNIFSFVILSLAACMQPVSAPEAANAYWYQTAISQKAQVMKQLAVSVRRGSHATY